MDEIDQSGGQKLPDIKRTIIDEAEVSAFKTEFDFTGVAVSLLIEAGSFVCIAGNLYPAKTNCWNRNQAVVGGHLVRLYKLIDGLLDQTCKHRRETSFVLARLAFECIVNLRYLIAFASEELFDSYRNYSLQHERRLLARIKENIKERSGVELPIERRMINSIERSFRVSGVDVDASAKSSERNWGGKNIFERTTAVGLEDTYLAAFGGASHSVHGNWQDLLEYHLDNIDDESFRAEFQWHSPRPQVLQAIARNSVEAVIDFVRYLAPSDSAALVDDLRELQGRIRLLSRLHEGFLSSRQIQGE